MAGPRRALHRDGDRQGGGPPGLCPLLLISNLQSDKCKNDQDFLYLPIIPLLLFLFLSFFLLPVVCSTYLEYRILFYKNCIIFYIQ